jgi:cardiolipin synthase
VSHEVFFACISTVEVIPMTIFQKKFKWVRFNICMLSVVFLAGCSSLPRFVPDMSRNAAKPIHMVGTHGALSKAQSKTILDRIKANASDDNLLDQHLAIEEAIVGSPLVVGNKVTLLQDGSDTYRDMLAAIALAKDHINLETYIFDDDDIGKLFAKALIEKQLQGVQVNVIRDSAGTHTTPNLFFEQLQAAGINVLEFNPINPLLARKNWALNQRDHRKLLIIDGEIVFMGGINISSVHSGSSFRKQHKPPEESVLAWRDTDIKLQGPVVAEFQKLFMATWEKQKGNPLAAKNYFPQPVTAGKQIVRAIGSSSDDTASVIYVALLSAISTAETSVQLTNAYFVPDIQLLTVLKEAAARGVAVTLILPSQTDSWLAFNAGRAHYTGLLKAGIKIYQRQGVLLHSKTALIDGVWATVGSTNLDWRSFLHNDELNAVVLGKEFGDQIQAMFNKDLAASEPVKLEYWERRSLDIHLKELVARLWEYWL